MAKSVSGYLKTKNPMAIKPEGKKITFLLLRLPLVFPGTKALLGFFAVFQGSGVNARDSTLI